MAIIQLSALLENTPGTLSEAVSTITEAGVNIRALTVADTKDFGILRMIVSDTAKTEEALAQYTAVRETPVVAVKMDDRAGALGDILKVLQGAEINIEYVYAFTSAVQGHAYVVLRVDEVEKAEDKLRSAGYKTLSEEDMQELL